MNEAPELMTEFIQNSSLNTGSNEDLVCCNIVTRGRSRVVGTSSEALVPCGIAALRAEALLPLSAVLERLQRFSSLLSFSNLIFYLTSYTLGIPLSSFLLASSVCSCFGNSVCVLLSSNSMCS